MRHFIAEFTANNYANTIYLASTERDATRHGEMVRG